MSASGDGALLLRELRRARGWSWRDKARELKRHAQRLHIERVASASVDSIARTIARWESGHYAHKPDERYQLLLGHIYARKDGAAALGPESDFARLLAALTAFGVDDEGRRLVRQLVMSHVAGSETSSRTAALKNSARLDAQLLDELEAAVAALRWQTAPAMPFLRLRLALAPILDVLEGLLRDSSSSAVRECRRP